MGSGASTGSGASAEGANNAPPYAGTSTKSSLSSRRLKKGLKSLVVPPKFDSLSRLSFVTKASSGPNDGKRQITRTSEFSELYFLGPQVMPSTHHGMEVRYAQRLSDDERVVVKVREKAKSFASLDDQQEWRASTEVMLNLPKSASIAQLYEVWEDTAKFYIVMELVEGQDLFDTLDNRGNLPIDECRDIIRQLMLAVAELHSRGCIHKDLKLENVMVSTPATQHSVCACESVPRPGQSPRSPTVKLIDFDTVEAYTPGGHSPVEGQSILGSDQYISQEAYAGNYSPASDVFAVGVIAYKVLTGGFPFHPWLFDDVAGENYVGSPKMRQIQQRITDFSIDYSRHPFPVNEDAKTFVSSLLASNEAERPSCADALRHPFLNPDTG